MWLKDKAFFNMYNFIIKEFQADFGQDDWTMLMLSAEQQNIDPNKKESSESCPNIVFYSEIVLNSREKN